MSTLKEKAEAILQEKNTKIIPENFSENLEILGIQGDISTYESGSGNLQFTENVVDLPDNNQFIMEIENGSNVLYKEGSNMGLAALKSVVAQTIGLTANKIKKNETILGITGTYEGIDTSDANATENDLVEGTSAYVNGVKIEGTLYDERYESGYYSFDNIGVMDNPETENLETKGDLTLPDGYTGVVLSKNMIIGYDIPYSDITDEIGLVPEVIKKGETILGITGTLEGGIDTSDATATENDIVENTSAYVDGVKLDGTLMDSREQSTIPYVGSAYYGTDYGTTSTVSFKLPQNTPDMVISSENEFLGYINNANFADSIGLTANIIKKDENVLGVIGTLETTGTDTSDANATANDILETKTAYVDGEKITGTIHKVTPEDNSMAGILTAGTWTDDGVYLYHKLENANSNGVPIFKPGYYQSITSNGMLTAKIHKATLATGIGLTEDKIKKGETICGVTGTYEGSGSATTVNTTLNLQIGERYNSYDHLPYMTFENLNSASFDITQLYNWNRNNGNGTPISQTILEMPYVYLKLEITEHYELEGGLEVMYELVALDKPLIYSFNEYDSEAQVAKNCYKASMQSGTFMNTDYDPETGEEYIPEGKNYATFNEFWTDFCNSIYSESAIKCVKPTRTTTYEIDTMMGYLYSNLV